ncbi:LutB/LldF family L-lactate oxidation iron-sulfur protein [Algihabitans albus]|uniref:LutB/LldF family L-lactate oxidation iron-sulfur protein n=1 Tax=Algihabitans albus TaxID=2164067 RepID=UPI0035D13A00
MQATSRSFKDNAHQALNDEQLRRALDNMKEGFIAKRAKAAAKLPEFDALRDQARDIKDHTLENLDAYLELYAEKVEAVGGTVHWCPTADDARKAVVDICQAVGAKTVTKGKSMIAEELALNEHLEANGLIPIETDLGEYIIQLRNEPPSHIIAPAIHLNKEQVASDFRAAHVDLPADRQLEEPQQLVGEARAVLRQKYLDADVGITGANFLIAETGTSIIVTNEGNGDLTQSLPKVHIVVASIEKIVPSLEDASAILRVLARSATGQEFSTYTTFSTGPKRPDDPDGPEQYHVILLDNGRSRMLGSEFQDMLRCIRCGACMNHCPVYHSVGGHAYGWVYPGPMGAVLTPSLIGVDEAGHLPNASTFCGRCEAVCPMRIPLPKMMRHWREQEFQKHLSPTAVRLGLGAWTFVARRPSLYHFTTGLKARVLSMIAGKRGRLAKVPLASGWTSHRDLPAPEGRTFMDLWAKQRRTAQRPGQETV